MTTTAPGPNVPAMAGERYRRLRRRCWRLLGGFLIASLLLFAVMFAADALGGSWGAAAVVIKSAAGLVIVTGVLACWCFGIVTWIELLSFRCPRCGKRFMLSRTSSLPTDRCKHCGLDLGEGGTPGVLWAAEAVFNRRRGGRR